MINTINDFGLYVDTTILVELRNYIDYLKEQGEDIQEQELYKALYTAFNRIILSLNNKESGYYLQQEFVTGSNVFNINNDFNYLRPIYRMEVNFGALPAAGTKSVAHTIPNVNSAFSFVKIFGSAFNPSTTTGIPIPFSSASAIASDLEITVDATNVNITTGGTDYSAYTHTIVTLEYIKE